MTLAQLIAALAACGGLRTGAAVDAAMREAAAAPERDFRQLIDVVRAAISESVNNGRLPEQRRYVSLSAIYGDRAVIELDGKHYQYAYSIKHIAGSDQVVLGAPVEVVEQYVPTAPAAAVSTATTAAAAIDKAVREAAVSAGESIYEAADGSIEVTLIRAGRSGNRNYYSDASLRESAPLFEGVRVFAKSDAEHLQGKGKDVRNLIGGIYSVRFVEGKTADTGTLVGTFKALDPTDAAVTKMTEAVKRGMQGLLGLSIDAIARTKQRREGGQVLREAVRFTKVHSVDLIVERAEAAAESAGADALAIANALQGLEGGPVASVNGKPGPSPVLVATDIAARPGAGEMAAGSNDSPRSLSASDVRAGIVGAAGELAGLLAPLMPLEYMPGDVIEATQRSTPKWLKLGESYLRATYPVTAERNTDRAPAVYGSMQVLGQVSSMAYNVVASDHERGIIFLSGGATPDIAVFINRETGQHTLQTLTRSEGVANTRAAKFATDGSIWVISYDASGGVVNMRVYTLSNGVYSEYAYKSFPSRSSAPGAFSTASNYMVALSKNTLLVAQSPSHQLGAVYRVSGGTIALGAAVLDVPPSTTASAQYLSTVSLSPSGEYLFASNYVPDNNGAGVHRLYGRVHGTDNFSALSVLPYIPGIPWANYTISSNCSTWLSDNLLLTHNSVFLEITGTNITGTYTYGASGGAYPMFPVNSSKTRYRSHYGTGLAVLHIDSANKLLSAVPADGAEAALQYTYQNSVPSLDRQSFYAISVYGAEVRLTKYTAEATFTIKPLLAMPRPCFRSLYMRTYDH